MPVKKTYVCELRHIATDGSWWAIESAEGVIHAMFADSADAERLASEWAKDYPGDRFKVLKVHIE